MSMSKEKQQAILSRMKTLQIHDKDLIEKFILGSGKGGQKINKTSSCVYLCHIPSGIEVKCQKDRSRELNRFLARRELCDRFERRLAKEAAEKLGLVEKSRRQRRRPSAQKRAKTVETKRLRTEKLAQRRSPSTEE